MQEEPQREKILTKRNIWLVIIWIVNISWLVFIISLSRQTGEETASLSLSIADYIYSVFSNMSIEMEFDTFHSLLRKTAHFGIYFISGALMFGALLLTFFRKKRRLPMAFASSIGICTLIAVVDELQKLWIDGRHLHWGEVLINIGGVVLGVGVASLISYLICTYQSRTKISLE